MLTVAEEILLLVLDDNTGTFINEPDVHLGYALAGAVLMDLAPAGRIDADARSCSSLRTRPTGDAIQDEVLARIVRLRRGPRRPIRVGELGRNADDLRDGLLTRLVERGILKEVDEKVLWVFETRRYPMIDGTEEREVKRRIIDVLFSDSTPDQSDGVIICLADACNLIEQLMAERELRSVEPQDRRDRARWT